MELLSLGKCRERKLILCSCFVTSYTLRRTVTSVEEYDISLWTWHWFWTVQMTPNPEAICRKDSNFVTFNESVSHRNANDRYYSILADLHNILLRAPGKHNMKSTFNSYKIFPGPRQADRIKDIQMYSICCVALQIAARCLSIWN